MLLPVFLFGGIAMKKMLCLVLACLMLPLCAFAEEENPLYDYACQLAQGLDELCSCEPYMQMFTTDQTILEMINTCAAGDHAEPTEAYMIVLDDAMPMLDALIGAEVQLPEFAMQQLRNRLFAAIPTQLNATLGSKAVAATAMCQYGQSFAIKGTNTLFYMQYAEGADVLVTFTPAGDGIMAGSATFLAADFPKEIGVGLGMVKLK